MAITKDQIKSKKASIPKSSLLARPNLKPANEELNQREAERILQEQLQKQSPAQANREREGASRSNSKKRKVGEQEFQEIKYFGIYQLLKTSLATESTTNVPMSGTTIEKTLRVSKKTAKRYLRIFVECGWVRLNQPFNSETSTPSTYDFMK